MPLFTNEPPPDNNRHGFRLLRTPASPPFRAFVISENLIGCPTHFIGNRTIPCEPPTCEPCENGLAWRWHGYLLVQVEQTTETAIFEMTATASDVFKQYYNRHGTTRGCYFMATRVNNRPNGRVLIQAKPADLAKIQLPPPMDLKKLLAHIWNIAPNQTREDPNYDRPPTRSIHIDRERPEIYNPSTHLLPTGTDKVGPKPNEPNNRPPRTDAPNV